MGLIVDLARSVLANAEALELQLQAANAPQPSFAVGTPATYPPESKHPKIFTTRHAIINASQTIHDLALGPADHVQYITGPARCHANALAVIEHYDIAKHVPLDGSVTFADLAKTLDVNQELLERLLRFATSARLFQENPLGSIAHTSVSAAIPLLSGWSRLMLSDDMNAAYQAWPLAVSESSPSAAKGTLPTNIGTGDARPFFTRLAAQEGGMKRFTQAMESRTKVSGGSDKSVFRNAFDWASLGSGPLIDVGGGSGHVTIPVAVDHPSLHVIVQDLASNADAAARQIADAGVEGRVTFQEQDFFAPQPEDLEPKAYFMKSILHDWNDDDCVRILRPLLPGIEKGARLFAIDRVAYEPGAGKMPSHQESMGQVMDLTMWSLLGAKERNVEQWKVLAKKTDERLKVLDYRTIVGSEWGMLELGF